MTKKDKNLLDIPARLLEVIGQHPNTERKKFIIMTAYYVIGYTVVLPVTLLHFLYIKDPTLFIENFEALGIYVQTSAKLVFGGLMRKRLFKLLEDTKQFWKMEECPVQIKSTLKDLVTSTLRIQQFFCIMLVFVVITIEICPFFTKNLAIGIFMFKEYETVFKIVLGIQEALLPFFAIHTGAFDTLFMYFCVNVIVQFKMLNVRLENLSTSEDFEKFIIKLVSYIKHHQYLLRFLQNLREFYSPVMLFVYTTQVLVLCAEMFILCEGDTIVLLIRHVITAITASLQLAFYCIISDYIAEEAGKVAGAIYNSDWHSQYLPTLKNTIPLVILRSQKEITFTAGGFYEMKSETLVAVMKLAWSVCTVIRAAENV